MFIILIRMENGALVAIADGDSDMENSIAEFDCYAEADDFARENSLCLSREYQIVEVGV